MPQGYEPKCCDHCSRLTDTSEGQICRNMDQTLETKEWFLQGCHCDEPPCGTWGGSQGEIPPAVMGMAAGGATVLGREALQAIGSTCNGRIIS
jgi:hypothetical protein